MFKMRNVEEKSERRKNEEVKSKERRQSMSFGG
jgi:hypothetical protein